MPHTSPERYAVVSCHVERPLDDDVWARFSALQQRRPAGFAIAALLRPADTSAGEDETLWAERARAAAARGPLGHHTHWTSPEHARPTDAEDAARRVLEEGARIRELGLRPALFCGGGWYTDVQVAEACADLGYIDCTPRARRPPYLDDGAPWALLAAPARLRLPSGRLLLAVPTTHSLGDLGRALARRSLPRAVHVYVHDTDLLDRRRRTAVLALLTVLARLAQPTELDVVAPWLSDLGELRWDAVVQDAK